MKPIGELTAQLSTDRKLSTPADTSQDSLVRFVFGRMHGAYGSTWLDRWRTGVLDPQGRDRGVANAMSDWAHDLQAFDRETVHKACEAVQAENRADHKFPPTKPEFMAQCRALRPRHAPQQTIEHRMSVEERSEVLAKFAALREAEAIKRAPTPLDHLQDLITEAYQLAGGSLEDLTQWQMVRQ